MMPDASSQPLTLALIVLAVLAYFFITDRKRKQVDDEFRELERRRLEALERIATALEKRQ
jgi:uncharacterized membrane protein